MRKKYATKLTGESVIKFRKPDGNLLNVKLVDLLNNMRGYFPQGFQPHGATEFLKSNYGELEPSFRYGAQSNSGFYNQLTKSGFLRSSPKSVTAEVRPYRKRTEYYYTFNDDFPNQANYEELANITIPEGLHKLIESGRSLVGQDFIPETARALERMIIENEHFLRVMVVIKQGSPDHYRKLGGDYLDKLLAQSKTVSP